MIANRHTPKIVAMLMALAVLLCLGAGLFSTQIVVAAGGVGVTMEYESKLFDTGEILEINILMVDTDWQAMLNNAMAEEYVQCDVEIGGTRLYNVGIRPKGNTSLSTIVNDPTTDRYSLKLEFDQYVEGQTCFGLDKLILNNSYADATYMKEALIYDMFQTLGADASLYSYAKVSVNGEYWGLYLALEAVEDSFLLRNYGTADGELYKPESMGMGGGNRGGGMFGGGGADLNYTGDDLDSYSTIWDGEVTNTGDNDHRRVVTALKNIASGTQLEQYMDIDNLVKYMAVHIFSENSDSLSGSMTHNYYLYEQDGRLNLLPWDYNLALGGMGMGRSGATDMVNGAIDDAWSSTDFFDTLLADEAYHAAYYAAMEQVVNYIQNGGFEAFYTAARQLIDELVKTDPNAFYTYEEYLTALDTFYEAVSLRGQSIAGQLNGTIPSTASAQRSSDALIDASHLDLSVMGSMNMGGGGGGFGGQGGFNFGGRADSASAQAPVDTVPPSQSEQAPDNGQFPQADQMPDDLGDMELPEGFDPSQFGGGGWQGGFPGQNSGNTDDNSQNDAGQGRPNMGNMPDMGNMSNQFGSSGMGTSALMIYGISAAVMLAAFLLALLYRRRPRK